MDTKKIIKLLESEQAENSNLAYQTIKARLNFKNILSSILILNQTNYKLHLTDSEKDKFLEALRHLDSNIELTSMPSEILKVAVNNYHIIGKEELLLVKDLYFTSVNRLINLIITNE